MAFTHYPKLDAPLFAVLHYYGPDDPRNKGKPPAVGESVVLYGHAVNFTRYYGSIFCSQPLVLSMDFASDLKVAPIDPDPVFQGRTFDLALDHSFRKLFPVEDGLREITDEDLPGLNYDARTPEIKYSPEQGGLKFFQIIYGTYLRLTLTHKGTEPITALRFACCCSVF